MAALQHEHPKLTAMAIDSMDGASFAAMLDRAIVRSQAPPKMIEHRPNETKAPPHGRVQCHALTNAGSPRSNGCPSI